MTGVRGWGVGCVAGRGVHGWGPPVRLSSGGTHSTGMLALLLWTKFCWIMFL